MKKKAVLTVVILIWLMFQSSCQSTENINIDISHAPPSWQGIVPGETTIPEYKKFIEGSDIIAKESIVESGEYHLFNSVIAFNLLSGTQVEAYFVDNILADLFFFSHLDISFSQAIKSYGDPKFLIIYGAWCSPAPLLSFGDTTCTHINAFIPEYGIEYGYQTKRLEDIRIDGNSVITQIELFDPNLYNELLESKSFFGLDKDTFEKYTKPWTGIGELLDN